MIDDIIEVLKEHLEFQGITEYEMYCISEDIAEMLQDKHLNK